MKTLEEIYQAIEKENIYVAKTTFFQKKAAIMSYLGDTVMAVDYSKIENSKEEKMVIAEEKAHYDVGAFYTCNSDFEVIEQMEYKARKHAYNTLMPYPEMKDAFNKGMRTAYELSEYFGVPEDDIARAYYLYQNVMNYAYEEES